MIQTRASEKERMINTKMLNALIYMLVDNNVEAVATLLADNGRFFSKSKLGFLAMLNSLFLPLRGRGYEIVVNKAIALYPFPGAECVEIRLLPCALEDDEYRPIKKIDFGSRKQEEEVVFRFVAEFKDGKIFRLKKPLSFLVEDARKEENDVNWN